MKIQLPKVQLANVQFPKIDGKHLGIIYRVAIAIVIIAVLLIGIWGFTYSIKAESTASYQKIDEGWDVVIDDSIYEDVNLTTFRVPDDIGKGDVVIIKNTLPETMGDNVSSMIFLIYLSAIEVKVDSQVVYSYGQDKISSGSFVGSGYHFIQLPYDAKGKEITITIQPAERAAFTTIPTPAIVPSEYAYTTFADRNMGNTFISVFIFMLGAMITIISSIAMFFENKSSNLTIIGVLATLIGAWAMCNSKVLQLFSSDLEINTSIEYIALFVAPIPLYALIIMVRQDVSRIRRIMLIACMIVILVFDVISTILHFTGVARYPKTLTIFHILAFTSVVIVAFAGWKRFSDMNKSEKLLNVSIIVLVVFGGLDILRFNFSKFIWPENERLADSILPFGTLVFILLLVGSYLASLFDMIESNAESAALAVMAYHDPLTGLYNRAKAEEKFNQLMDDDMDYFLINMDLNGLKRMNDKYGHEKGDFLITTFADILKECFEDIGIVVRMGGDEFLVIIDAVHEGDIKPALANMIRREAAKTKETGMRIETSFGISSNIEDRSRNPEQVYSIADSRMYAMKQKSKTARRD